MSYQEHSQHKDRNQTEAHKPPQRFLRETRRDKTNDEVTDLIRDGNKKKERMSMQDIELYRGRKPIRIFTDQVTTVEVRQNLGNLVVKLENAVKYLEAAQFTHNECKRIWGKSWMEDKSQELCTENIAAINEFIRQALNPVETSFWNLNALCATKINPTTFSLIREGVSKDQKATGTITQEHL